ncbi:MAG: hypothetical protein ACLP9L_13515, partial [Thermoguttaceae bacterium]
MKLCTMLAGLVVAGILASSVFAQTPEDFSKGKSKRTQQTFEQMMTGRTGTVLTQDIYVAAVTKNVPKDRKERVKTAAETRFQAIAKAAEVDLTKGPKGLTKDQYA